MATHSSVLAWRIPGTAEPSGLPRLKRLSSSSSSSSVILDKSPELFVTWIAHLSSGEASDYLTCL